MVGMVIFGNHRDRNRSHANSHQKLDDRAFDERDLILSLQHMYPICEVNDTWVNSSDRVWANLSADGRCSTSTVV